MTPSQGGENGKAGKPRALERAGSLDDLWRRLQQHLTAVASGAIVDAGFICRGDQPLVRFHSGPESNPPQWACTLEGNPMHRHCVANPKARVVRLSDVAGDRHSLQRSEFGRLFLQPGGSPYAVTLCFRYHGEIEAEIVLHRKEQDGDFLDAEMTRLRQLHRDVTTALDHLRALHHELAVRETLETVIRNSPMSLLLLDRRLRPVVCNRTAKQQCAAWNLGAAARTINSPEAYQVPAPIQQCAEALQRRWQNGHGHNGDLVERVVHPGDTRLEASLELLEYRACCLGSPLIRVQFYEVEATAAASRKTGTPDLSKLTPQELEVIRLVARGMSNLEIATELSKSVFTVKTQVHTAFRKLGIRRRAKLVLLFR